MKQRLSLLLSLAYCTLSQGIFLTSATAQVTPDGTTNTTVDVDGSDFTIQEGERAGGNLFHSFGEFSVPTDGSAFFNNAADIVNIFSRVTGGNISNIDGLLRANGSANLFLLNPAGIIFGENARLDIGGSFFGTSADSFVFEDGEFSATDLDNPPLLTINAPIGLNFRDNPGDIIVRGDGNGARLLDSEVIDTQDALRVGSDATIGIVGGNLFFEDATIKTAGGRIEIGSVAGGQVNLVEVANGFTFDYSGVETFRDISLSGRSAVDASGLGGGDIQVAGQNISITGVSGFTTFTLGSNPGGDINILATESVEISGVENELNFFSAIANRVFPNGTADAGDINIETGRLRLGDRAFIGTFVSGQGDAGNITINARDSISLENQGNGSLIASSVANTGVGNAGNIELNTGSLTLNNGAQLLANTLEQGNGGNVTINTTDNVSLVNSSIVDVSAGGGGSITVNARNFELLSGSALFGGIGVGLGSPGAQAGDITINVSEAVSFDGSSAISRVGTTAIGNAGDINITTGNLSLTNVAQLDNSTRGQGDAGNIVVQASDTVSLANNSFIFSNVGSSQRQPDVGVGKVGNIFIEAREVSLTDTSQLQAGVFTGGKGEAAGIVSINAADSISFTGTNTGIFSDVESQAMGDGSDIQLSAPSIFLDDGAVLLTNNAGVGDAGNVNINANTVSFDGSSATSRVGTTGIGNAGDINITTGNLSLTNVARLDNSTRGQGDAGNIVVQASDTVSLANNSFIFSNVGSSQRQPDVGVGKVGNIFIEAREVSLTDTSQLQAGVFTGGKGEAAGIVSINASDSISFTGTNTGIFSNVESQAMGDGSDIQLSAPSIFLDDGAVLSADNAGVGDAGNVNINANTVSFDGSSATSRVGTTGIGNAGAISINTSNLTLINGAQIGSSTFGQGNAGSVTINATDAISLDGENRDGVVSLISSSVESGAVGNAGIVSINTRNLTLTNGAQILSATFGKGNAGNVTINATDTVSLDGEAKNGANSTISSSVQPEAVGNGGDVNIDTSNLFLTNGAQIDSGTFGEGNAGNVTIKATGVVSLDGEGKDGFDSGIASSVSSSAVGNGGNISIDAKNLSLTNGAFVSSDTSGEGDAGSLTVRASESVELSGVSAGGRSRLLANAIQGSGNGGDLTVFTDELIVRDGAIISVSNFPGIEGLEPGTGEAGNVRIEANSLRLENGQINAATESGAGGNITLQIADNLILEDNSLISARANNNANGGNIDIDAEFIVAFPSQFDGNDILASAQQGQGGNINITAEALLGIKERPQNPLTNDIDASSEFGLDGSVSIFTPDVNTLQKDTEIPNNLVESETLGANACSGRGATEAASSFTVKGKGGLPPIPTKPFMADLLIPDGKPITLDKKSDLTSLLEEESETEPENPNYIPEYIKPIKTSRGDIYPARGIIKTEDGRVILTTYPTDNINTRTPHIATNCSLVKDEQQ